MFKGDILGNIYSRAVYTQGWYLFSGGICSRVEFIQCSNYSRRDLLKGRIYSRVVSVQGLNLFNSVIIYSRVMSRAVSIQGWYQGDYLLKGCIYSRVIPRALSTLGQYLLKDGIG